MSSPEAEPAKSRFGDEVRWILDDGPFGYLAKVIDPRDNAHWQADVLLVAGKTAADASPTSQSLLDLRVGDEPLVAAFEIRLGSNDPAEQVLIELHPDTGSTANLAEYECIAWALEHGSDAVFVCADKRASLTALAELGRERVAHPFDLWLDLRKRKWLSPRGFDQLCQLTRKHDQGLPRMPRRISKLLE